MLYLVGRKQLSENEPKAKFEVSARPFFDRKQLSENELKAKFELSARSFFEISESSAEHADELSEKNYLIERTHKNN